VDEDLVEGWNEHQYRTMYQGLTHQEYLLEPGRIVERQLAIAEVKAEIEKESLPKDGSS
jgi:hypothetical protein